MMLAAMTIDEVDPRSGESFEGVDLAGINDVAASRSGLRETAPDAA